MSRPIKIAITPGEPAGIGPDLIIKLAQEAWQAQLVVFADADMMMARASALDLPLSLLPFDDTSSAIQPAGSLYIKQINTNTAWIRSQGRLALAPCPWPVPAATLLIPGLALQAPGLVCV